MSVKIGHAVSDENNSKGSATTKAGNQTGKEVCTREWYDGGWTHVFRPKSEDVAEKIASAMEKACANKHIGYSQPDRLSLYAKALEADFSLDKITTDCNCDCSTLVAVCCLCAGLAVSKTMYTGNEQRVLMSTGAFDDLHTNTYLSTSDNLKRGDILLKSGHTAIVLTDARPSVEYFPRYTGTSKSVVDALNSIGCNSKFTYRKKIANANPDVCNGMGAYIGLSSQNSLMLDLLKKGKLIIP